VSTVAPFASARQKVGRARFHFDELKAAINRFGDSKPFEIRTELPEGTGRYVQRLIRAQAIPGDFGLIAGDVFFDLRSALDHLAFQTVLGEKDISALPEKVAQGVQFPIAKDAGTYRDRRAALEATGAPNSVLELLDSVEPYKGGSGEVLWKLHRLNIIDKHRLLLTTWAVTQTAWIDTLDVFKTAKDTLGIPVLWAAQLAAKNRGRPSRFEVAKSQFVVPGRPVKVGDVLMEGPAENRSHERTQYALQLVIAEPGIVDGEPLIDLVTKMFEAVEQLIASLEAVFSTSAPPESST
jgi:hypothetical protein